MKSKAHKIRIAMLSAVFIVTLLLYALRLMQIQVVEGDQNASLVDRGWSSTQTIKAARGEILDRSGRPMAVNTIGRDVVIDKAYVGDAELNAVLLRLIRIMEAADEDWIDNLPLTETGPFRFKEGEAYAGAVSSLKKSVDVAAFATADDVVSHLRENYDLEDMNEEDFRKLAGVRYEMQRRGFSLANPYTFATDIKIETVPKIKERSFELPGVDVVESPIRQYVSGDIAPHIIGQIGPLYMEQWNAAEKERGTGHAVINGQTYAMNDVIGKSGAELGFEKYLKGTDGERKIMLNSKGDVIDVVDEKEQIPGNTVMLTINSQLQKVAQDALENKIISMQNDLVNYPPGKGHEANAGAAVVVDVKTGEILALATYPSYNLSTYGADYDKLASDPLRPLFNRASMGIYTPGSIFKPVVALAGINEGVVTPSSHVFCGGVYTLFQDYQPRCLSTHLDINVVNALRWSCNIYFYDTGWRVGINKIDEYAKRLGLGEPTGFELGENIGRLASPETKKRVHANGDPIWRDGDVLQASIGQGDTMVSPLQLANYTATLANNGKRMKLTALKSVKSYTFDETVYEHEPEIVEVIDAPTAFDTIREGMVAASRIGSAAATFGSYPITVASKTGTPETHTDPNSTFIAYAPAGPGEEAELAVCVIIEKGWHGYTGAPVAKEIFDAYFFSNNGKNAAASDYGVLLS